MKLTSLSILASLVVCSELLVDKPSNAVQAPHQDNPIESFVAENGIERLKDYLIFDETGTLAKHTLEWAKANNNEEMLEFLEELEEDATASLQKDASGMIIVSGEPSLRTRRILANYRIWIDPPKRGTQVGLFNGRNWVAVFLFVGWCIFVLASSWPPVHTV